LVSKITDFDISNIICIAFYYFIAYFRFIEIWDWSSPQESKEMLTLIDNLLDLYMLPESLIGIPRNPDLLGGILQS